MNHGLDLDLIKKINPRDYKFSGEEACKLVSWKEYLPENELQIGLYDDTKSCVTFAITNQIETLMNRDYINDPWLIENGYIKNGSVNFSDRFTAVMSNTTRSGNSGRNVYNAIREFGLIPEDMHPFQRRDRELKIDFDKYHDKSLITEEMLALGKEFNKRFEINYYYVAQNQICSALEKSPLLCYVRCACTEKLGCSGVPGHAVMMFTKALKDGWMQLYDSYLSSDRDFIRLMDKDYQFVYGLYSITIKSKSMLYKEKGKSDIYLLGADKKLHPIVNEIAYKELFGDFNKVKEVANISDYEIGDMVGLIKR